MDVVLFARAVFMSLFFSGFTSGSEILFTKSPQFIQPKETPYLTIHCGLMDVPQGHLPFTPSLTHSSGSVHPWSVMISRDDTVVASITQFTPATALVDLDTIRASGNLSINGTERGYLELTWSDPDIPQGGKYKCEILGVDSTGQNFNFVKSFTVPALSLMDLAARVSSLELQNQGLKSDVSTLTQSNANLSHVIGGLQNQVAQLKNRNEYHVETGEVTCDQSWRFANSDFSTKTMTVHFKTSYSRSPEVLLSVTELTDSAGAIHAYQARVTRVYTDRFTFTCGQGRGVGRLVIGWISVAV